MNPSERHQLRKILSDSNTCPTPDRLAACWDGSVTGTERTTIEHHTLLCTACSAEWVMLADFHSATPGPAEIADVNAIVSKLHQHNKQLMQGESQPEPIWWKRLFSSPVMARLALSLTVLVIVLALSLQWRAAQTGTLDDAASITLEPSGDIKTAPQTFKWTPVPNAASYKVVLSDVDNTEIFSQQTTITSIVVPDAIRASIVANKTLIVKVTAYDAANKVIAESQPSSFRLMP